MTRRTRRGGATDYQRGQTPFGFGSMLGVKSYENPAAMQQANALMKNPLFNLERIKATGEPPVNKQKIANFAKSFASQIVQRGPNGRVRAVLPTQEQGQQQLASFATAMGFTPQARQPVTKNWFGNPVYGNTPGYMGPMAGQSQFSYGTGGLSFRGGRKSRRKTRRSYRR